MNKPIHYATKKLKQYRIDRDWTQEQFASFLSLQLNTVITRGRLHKWENAQRPLNASIALEISNATKIPIMELVTRKEA